MESVFICDDIMKVFETCIEIGYIHTMADAFSLGLMFAIANDLDNEQVHFT